MSDEQPGEQERRPVQSGSGSEAGNLASRLRSLGYLQDPLARFISTGSSGPQGLWRSYVTVGTKVGIVLGLLAFLLLSLGFTITGRFVLLSLGDRLLFYSYLLLLALPLGLLIGLVLAAAFGVVARFTRKAETKVTLAARKFAIVVALCTLGYLLLGWIRMREVLLGVGTWSDLGAAVVCAGASWLVGRAAFAAALYLGARRRRWDPLEMAPPRRGLYSLLALLGVAMGAVLILLWAGGREEPLPAEAFEVEANERRVLLVGIDGLDLAAVRSMIAEERLPNWKRVLQEGALVEFEDDQPRDALAWWMDVSTGFPPEEHGIAAPTHAQPRGLSGALFVDRSAVGFGEVLEKVLPLLGLSRETPFSAGLLLQKPLLEIVSDADVPAATIAWWMSHPVNPGLGAWQVSERALWAAVARGPEGAIDPSGACPDELAVLFEHSRVFPPSDRSVRRSQPTAEERAVALDATAVSVATELLQRPEFALLQVGLWEPNAVRGLPRRDPSFADERERVLRSEATYERIDERLGRLLEAARPSEAGRLVCVVVAPEARRDELGTPTRSGGWCVLLGPEVRRPSEVRRASSLDLVPTLLRVLGFPVCSGMPGQPLLDLFVDLGARPRISSFGPPALRPLPSPEEDREALEMFRAFGYL